MAGAHADAAEPRLERLEPQGAQRGTEATVVLHGARLGKAPEQLLFYRDGIETKELKSLDDNRVEAKLALDEQCPLGIHALRVRTATGLSNLMTFHVGALPEVAEAEPNNELGAAQATPFGSVVNGVVTTEDVDYFVVEASEGQRISVEVEGVRMGRAFFDPIIAVLDETGRELATCDDAPLMQQDAYCSILAPKPGKYVIMVRESAFVGTSACGYRLHIGDFPRPAAVFPPGGRPGETLEIRWIGDPRGERTETVTLPSDGPETDVLFAKDEHGTAPSGNPVRVVDIASAMEAEPNDDRTKATPFEAPAAVCGVIGVDDKGDYYAFEAKKGEVFDVRAFARTLGSPLDAIVRVRELSGKGIVGNDDDRGAPDSYMRFTAPADGQYLLEVQDHLGRGGADFVYRIEVTRPASAVDVALEEMQRYEAQTVQVPRGNSAAVMASAARRDFSGALRLEFGDLPPGVTVEALPLAAGDSRAALLFTAAKDAPKGASLCSVAALSEEADKPAASRFKQQSWLVRGSNNRPVWNHFADRAAVATVEPVPFRLKLEQPAAPLVRGGSKSLKVVAQRDEGFDAPISVRMLYNPPGVSSNASISIAKGQNEAVIPFTANGSAAIREWKLVALGQANIDGRMTVASLYASLRIVEPYVGLTFTTTATEQGKPADCEIAVKVNTPFEGQAKAELLGLPPGVSAEAVSFDASAESIAFKLAVTPDARVGRHKQLICRVTITEGGEPVVHSLGTGELNIDPALPAEKTTADNVDQPEGAS